MLNIILINCVYIGLYIIFIVVYLFVFVWLNIYEYNYFDYDLDIEVFVGSVLNGGIEDYSMFFD